MRSPDDDNDDDDDDDDEMPATTTTKLPLAVRMTSLAHKYLTDSYLSSYSLSLSLSLSPTRQRFAKRRKRLIEFEFNQSTVQEMSVTVVSSNL